MADQRSLSFGVRFGTDTAPLDELNEKQKQVQEEAERTAEELEQVGEAIGVKVKIQREDIFTKMHRI